MTYTIQIRNSNQSFPVEEGESILDAALRHGISLPYACRNGVCGACKGKCISGEIEYPSPELLVALPQAERDEGFALFCQGRACSDLEIEADIVDENAQKPEKLPARVVKLEQLAHDVMRLYLKLPAGKRLPFLAGQYIDILLSDGRRRSFSIANPPHDDEFIELHIRHVPGGRFSDFLFSEMKEGAILRIEAPFGQFHFREGSERPMIFMAGGTGFAPIKGVIEHILAEGVTLPMHFYWGVRAKRDLYLHDMAQAWADEHPFFNYIPVLSDPMEEDQWQGRTGFVHEAILEDFTSFSEHDVYACGPPVMIHSGQQAFLDRGLPEDRFFCDPFEYAADNPAKES
ncbi:MAG: CDP-6-deoxy-delta-3,4-glucoseen reductase [Gammaproteobacteria bacterium]|nr:MAG: CDP-6-deoxy-delta-3,4-glucoseen reductase [Gammaproteobacteria bacterium]